MTFPIALTRWKGWDKAGIFLSVGCAVHCFIMALLPKFLGEPQAQSCCHECNEWSFHSVALIFVMAVAAVVCIRCFSRSGWVTLLKMAAGLALLWAPQSVPRLVEWETALTVTGAAFMFWAHWGNLRNDTSGGHCCGK